METSQSPQLNDPKDPFDQFVYSVSHDLQEPVRLIQSFQKLFLDKYGDTVPEEGKQYLDFASTNAQKLQRMIRALVDLSRVSRNAEPETEVDLNELLGHFQKSMAPKLQLREAQLEIGAMPVVTGQPSLLATLWRALLENSLEHTGNGPVHIQAGCLVTDSQVECWVQDDGPGIYPSYQDQIFHIFKKAGTTGEGVGAGLAIAKAIVEKHGGTIWINTETETGVRIHFTLPR